MNRSHLKNPQITPSTITTQIFSHSYTTYSISLSTLLKPTLTFCSLQYLFDCLLGFGQRVAEPLVSYGRHKLGFAMEVARQYSNPSFHGGGSDRLTLWACE